LTNFLPFALPSIGDEEISEVEEVLRSGWLTTGPRTARFEEDFAAFSSSKHAIAVNSATSGLHLALEAVGVRSGDQVITTPYTFTATAEVVRYLGADPVFIDIDPVTMNMDPQALHRGSNFGGRVKAVIPVHFGGLMCDMGMIHAVSRERGWKVVEDAAHALPATHAGQMVGSGSDMSVFSFYVTKTLATGEGGMIITNNEDYAQRMKTMRLHGISRDAFDRYRTDEPSWYYEVVAPGYKYNMTDMAAAIGIHQLKKAWGFQRRRKWIADQYTQAFAKLPMQLPHTGHGQDVHAWHLYVIQLQLDSLRIGRDQFIEQMTEAGVGTSVHFIPLHIQPYWRDRYQFVPEDFPVSYRVYQRAVSLPIYPKMSDSDVGRVIEAVKNIVSRHAK